MRKPSSNKKFYNPNKLYETIALSVSKDEKEYITAYAKSKGYRSTAAFARQIVLDHIRTQIQDS